MSEPSIRFDATFADFQFLQRYMARRIVSRNRRAYVLGLVGVVLAAIFLTATLVVISDPYIAFRLLPAVPYPVSFFVVILLCLVGAIISLAPTIATRRGSLRMQVSASSSPLLGPTTLIVDEEGLVIERKLMRTKYLWPAFQGVEIARNRVILPIDTGIGVIIPASAFSDDAARYSFAAEVSKRIREKRPVNTTAAASAL